MSNYCVNSPLANLALAPVTTQQSNGSGGSKGGSGSWFEAMSRAWGEALDKQADKIETLSAGLGTDDSPAAITELSAQSMKMGFLSTSSHTAITSVAEALKTQAQKQ